MISSSFFRSSLFILLGIPSAVFAGCGGRAADPAPSPEPTPSATGAAGSASSPSAAAACSATCSPQAVHAFSSRDDVAQSIAGRWQLCSGETSDTSGTGVGIEITADGHFYYLTRAADGSVVHELEPWASSLWSINTYAGVTGYANDGSFDILLQSAGGGGYSGFTGLLADCPRRLVLVQYTSAKEAKYVPMP